ncbi:transposase [Propionibacterium acidifaciens]|uniref:transposase n=1 Tax=Propionibacterium acidifaciens TaxID=556499 RepID=UPI0028DD388F|nr:transposase [Propionibacterium acidifaciens]
MAEATTQVKALLDAGWEVHTARLRCAWSTRPGPAACSPRKDSAPGRSVDRRKTSQSLFGALSLIGKKVKLYPIEGNRNTEQTILALERLQRETEAEKIAVVPDNARFHHAKMLAGLYEPGQLLERITPIHPPPYAPDHTIRSSTSGTRPGTTSRTFSARPPKKPSARPPHTSPAEHSTTTSNTSPPRETRNDFVS